MFTRGKFDADHDRLFAVEELFVFSWELQEYLLSVTNEDFFKNVRHCLASATTVKAPGTTEMQWPSRKRLVKSKHYFAGGSVRFMFEWSTKEVIEALTFSVDTVGNIVPYIKGGIGDLSNDVVNRLLCSYPHPRDATDRVTSIASEWAAAKLAMKKGPDLV